MRVFRDVPPFVHISRLMNCIIDEYALDRAPPSALPQPDHDKDDELSDAVHDVLVLKMALSDYCGFPYNL